MKYILTSPNWEIASADVDVILKMFEGWICDECKQDISVYSANYEDLEPKEKISHLMITSCGAEFIFEVQQDI